MPKKHGKSDIRLMLEDRHATDYESFIKCLGELQPLAFLITASLLIATFLGDGSRGQELTILACLFFFVAYLGFHAYYYTKSFVVFYWAVTLVLSGFVFLFYAVEDLFGKLFSKTPSITSLYAWFLIMSILFVLTFSYFLDTKQLNKMRYYSSLYFMLLASCFGTVFSTIYTVVYSHSIYAILGYILPALLFFISILISVTNQKEGEMVEVSFSGNRRQL
nr:hypothetical protein [uncultured Methanolobus sp.]